MSEKKGSRARHDEDDRDEERDPAYWEERIASDPELASRVLEALGGVVPNIFKRVALSGMGNVLLSEDGLRSILSENKKIPKEAVNLILGQADLMRREVLRIISREIRIFLENMDFGGEIAKILTSVSFEIKTEIRFIPNDQSVKAQVKSKAQQSGVAPTSGKGRKEREGLDDDSLDEPLEERGLSEESQAGEDERNSIKISFGSPLKPLRPRWGRKRRDRDDPEHDR